MNAELLSALIARNDDDFARWAIRWLDFPLDHAWQDIDDNERRWLVKHGIVQDRAVPTVRVDGFDSWSDEWRENHGASWPTYSLEIHGAASPITVMGWHYCWYGRYGTWVQQDQDEACASGTPRVKDWTILAGEGLDCDRLVPVWRRDDGKWVTFDLNALNEALYQAAKTVDHGEPSWRDIPRDDMLKTYEDGDEGWIISGDDLLSNVWLERGSTAEYYAGTRSGRVEAYMYAWSHSRTTETFPTRQQALADLVANHSADDRFYATQHEALGQLVARKHAVPAPYHCGINEDGFFVALSGADYHPTEAELFAAFEAGWNAILARVRAVEEADSELDAVIADRNPWVTFEDSLEAGNCEVGTANFLIRLSRAIGATGHIGAVRAKTLLSVRDDARTRAACRQACIRTQQ